MRPEDVQAWLHNAPGKIRALWILRGVTGGEICDGHVVRDLQVEDDGVARLAWVQGGLYGRELRPRLSSARVVDGQLRVTVFNGEYIVLPFNIENARETGISEADGMPAGDDEAEALVAFPYGFGDI